SNIYAAELMGIAETLRMAVKVKSTIEQVTIFTDNQATIYSSRRPKLQSGQYILRRIVQRYNQLQQSNVKVCIQWIPSYHDVEDNEIADTIAKEATN
ncbi:hypothetical protein F5884DRAFT_634968, partial [Xylogone sp. PMI_703]